MLLWCIVIVHYNIAKQQKEVDLISEKWKPGKSKEKNE